MDDLQFTGLGLSVSFSKTVSESDVYLFAGITGDLSPNHVDAEFMKATPYGARIAHGALLVGYMSRTSTMIAEKCVNPGSAWFPVSLGYDKVRFLAAVPIGDTISIVYTMTGYDAPSHRSTAAVEMKNQRGEMVAVATHIMKWLAKT